MRAEMARQEASEKAEKDKAASSAKARPKRKRTTTGKKTEAAAKRATAKRKKAVQELKDVLRDELGIQSVPGNINMAEVDDAARDLDAERIPPKPAIVSSKPEEEREPTDEEIAAAIKAEWNAPEPEPPPKAKPAKGASKSKKPRSKVGKKTGAAVVNSNQEVVLRVGLSRPGVNSGGAHDLSDNVPAVVKLIVLTVNGHPGE